MHLLFKYYRLINILTVLVFITGSNMMASEKVKINANASAKLDYYEAKVDDGRETFDRLIAFYDTIIGIHAHNNEYQEQIKYLLKKAEFAHSNGNGVKSFHTYRETIAELNKHDKSLFSEERKQCLYSASRNAMDLGMFDESAAYAFELLQYVDGKDQNYIARSYSILSFIFVNLKKMTEAEEYNDKAMHIIKSVDTLNPLTFYSVYNNLAGIFFTKQQPDSAVKYLKEAKKHTKDIEDPKAYNIIYHNFAMIYEGIGEYTVAKDYYFKALEIVDYDDHLHITALTYHNLARLYNKMNQKDKSLEYYNKALHVATTIGATKIRGDALVAMSKLYYDKQDYKTSRDLLEIGQKALDSVFNSQNVDRISILTNNYETKNEEIEKELMQQKMAFSDLKKNILTTVLLIVLVVVVIISIKLTKQSIKNKALNKTISSLEQKNQQYEEHTKYKFESIIDIKNKELTTTTISLLTANEILFEVRDEVEKLKTCHKSTEKSAIFKSIDNLFKSYNPEHGNEEFRLYFEQVQQSFFTKLNEMHPNLSYEDQRICALLIVNLSAKEIANMTNKSIRTIETNIYHLRKTMDIPAKVKTVAYLRQFVD